MNFYQNLVIIFNKELPQKGIGIEITAIIHKHASIICSISTCIAVVIPQRYVSDRELFEKLVEESLKLKTTRTAIGGNAPVIANRMAREGAQVLG